MYDKIKNWLSKRDKIILYENLYSYYQISCLKLIRFIFTMNIKNFIWMISILTLKIMIINE